MFRKIGLCLLAFFMSFVFLLSGLIVNFVQLILYLSLYNNNRPLYRKINYYLIYTSWAPIVTVCEWWSNSRCNIYGDEESLRWFGKEHSLVLMNHKYEVDWLMTWFICDKLRVLGNAKTLAKKALRNIPIVGWGWIFAEMIFLERNWEKDKLTMGSKLDRLVDYKDPIMILFFAEGTRFTPEKHQASIEFSKARNLPQLKHHLCPRTSGFNFSAKHLKDKMPAVYDLEIGFPDGPVKPTFSNMLKGHSFVADMHIRRIPMSEIPTDTDEATTKWLYQLYQEKDKLMDNYLKTNMFPGRCVKLHRSYRTLLNTIFWSIATGLPFLYFVFKILTTGNFWVTTIALTILILLGSTMFIMVGATKASKGSSYGKEKSPVRSTQSSLNNNASSTSEKETLQTN